MKKILVTGAAGFIGFHVSQALVAKGDLVWGIDNFNDYYAPSLKRARALILQTKGVSLLEADLNDRKKLLELFERENFTHVLHLAAQAGVRYAEINPDAYLTSNVTGFLSILETLKKDPRIKLIFASSSSVYGCNVKTPFAVQDRSDTPGNLYAATKKANELMAFAYHNLYGMGTIGLRYFTVYGPWGRPDMAYFSFTKALLENNPITLYNEGKMERDFTYIDDIVVGTLAAIDYASTHFEIFNLGNSHPVKLLHFLSLLEKKLNKKAQLLFKGKSLGEVEKTFADISESQEKLGFKPTISLEAGLDYFIDWYHQYNTA